MLNKILSLIFPPICVRCKRIINHGFLCYECNLEYDKEQSDGCLSCGKPHNRCRCDSKYLENEKIIYSIPYRTDGPSRAILLKMKTSKIPEIVSHLTDKMAEALKANGIKENFIITYVPRAPYKKRLEGIDQSKVLSYALAEKINAPIFDLILCQNRRKEQKELEYTERDIYAKTRYSLVLGAEEKLIGKRVILIDDIITSGATAKICMGLLLEAGADEVNCLFAGRSVKY